MAQSNGTIALPAPRTDSGVSIERALRERRSVREYRKQAITLPQLSQLLWAAQGITAPGGLRTAPSAGALYPLEVYVLVGDVDDLAEGVYRYQAENHTLRRLAGDDRRREMERAALGQDSVGHNAVLLVFASVDARTTGKYGKRGLRYVEIEVGHAAENVMLQAQALGLGAAVVGAFSDEQVAKVLDLPKGERPLYLMPVGVPR
jgi:SagB-type dehydrogenase family enzyme